MTVDTKAMRAEAQRQADAVAKAGGRPSVLADMLRQCADEIDTLRELVREALECDTDYVDGWNERAEKALK